MKKILALAWLSYVFVSCSQNPQTPTSSSDASTPEAAAKMEAPAGADALPSTPEAPTDRLVPNGKVQPKLIRSAELRFRVRDFATAGAQIYRQVQANGGMVQSSNEQKTDNSIENSLVIRVPAARFDALLSQLLQGSMFTDTKQVSSEDVTEEYVDVEARLKSKKAVEQRYLELLRQARNVQEVVQVEEQLRVIREEIEAKEARLKYLNDQVSYSTIRLCYYQQTPQASAPQEAFWLRIWYNIQDGAETFFEAFIALFYVLPSVVVLYGGYRLLRWWWQRRRSQ